MIETQALALEWKVLMMDNITWLLHEGQNAKNAIKFMRAVSDLKKKLGMSIHFHPKVLLIKSKAF